MLSDFWTKEKQDGNGQGITWQNPRVKLIVASLALLGILLMLWPGAMTDGKSAPQPAQDSSPAGSGLPSEEQLASMLSDIEGAGKVQVKMSFASDGFRSYVTNERKQMRSTAEKELKGVSRETTEETADASLALSNNSPVLVETKAPSITGVLVIAEGAASPMVEERLMSAVTGLLGIPSSCVQVLPGSERK